MTVTYTLKINQIDCVTDQETQDRVITVHWAYTGTNEQGRSAGFGGSTTLDYNPENPFIPYDQLTEQEVTAWVLDSWSEETRNTITAAIDCQLAISTPGLPWAQTSDSVHQPDSGESTEIDPVPQPDTGEEPTINQSNTTVITE